MQVKVRKIGNAMGVILPKAVIAEAELHAGDALDIHIDSNGVSLTKQIGDLKDRILKGIIASDQENLEFSESFSDTESESW
jgi:antitoxin component of MazEF toxin-antitoxin module